MHARRRGLHDRERARRDHAIGRVDALVARVEVDPAALARVVEQVDRLVAVVAERLRATSPEMYELLENSLRNGVNCPGG